jgi:hypothetical protein
MYGRDNCNTATCMASDAPTPAPAPTPPSNPPLASDQTTGSGSLPGWFSASADVVTYDSGEEYEYKGKLSGAMYLGGSKRNNACDLYVGTPLSCKHASAESGHSDDISIDFSSSGNLAQHNYSSLRSSHNPQGVKTIYLPKTVLNLLQEPLAHHCSSRSKRKGSSTTLVIADTGTTNHMLLDKSAFILYTPVLSWQVPMGNNSFAPIGGQGTAIILLNSKKIPIHNCLHIPEHCNPLYNLCAHQRQWGCEFIGMFSLGMYVYFPTFIIEVDTATDCHLEYAPIKYAAGLADLDYVQPKYMLEQSASTTSVVPTQPIKIEPDNADPNPEDKAPTYAAHWLKQPPPPPTDKIDLSSLPAMSFTKSLNNMTLEELIQLLYDTRFQESDETIPSSKPKRKAADQLTCMDQGEIIELFHHSILTPPLVRLCDTPNPLDNNSHWAAEELHRVTGCHHFQKY